MIELRSLQIKDAPFMLEWMKDESINCFFQFDFKTMTLESVVSFIQASHENSVHYAIVDDELDEYLGTISLKNIDKVNRNAEYAISLRLCAISNGVAKLATDSILNIGFNQLKLKKIYLNVLSDNKRAVKFYEKYGFKYEGEFVNHIFHKDCYKNLKWFAIIKKNI